MKETFFLPSSSHLCFVTIAAAKKLRSNIVETSDGWCCGGCAGSADGRDDGDGRGVWCLAHDRPADLLATRQPLNPLQACPFKRWQGRWWWIDGNEVMNGFGYKRDGGGVWCLRHVRAAGLHALRQPTIPKRWQRKSWLRCGHHGDNCCWSYRVMMRRWWGRRRGEGVFPWCVNAQICTSSYVKHTSSQLVTSNQ